MNNLSYVAQTAQSVLPSVLGWGLLIGLVLSMCLNFNTKKRIAQGETILKKSVPTPDNGQGAEYRFKESLNSMKLLLTNPKQWFKGTTTE